MLALSPAMLLQSSPSPCGRGPGGGVSLRPRRLSQTGRIGADGTTPSPYPLPQGEGEDRFGVASGIFHP